MHSSQHAASARPLHSSEDRTDNLSFPPTQRMGLLCSSPSTSQRSRDQVANLLQSSRELLDLLNVRPLEHANAL